MHHHPALRSTDHELIQACASVIGQPKAAPPDSFVLHAPLELLARALLLERVPLTSRALARDRLRALADEYAAAGAPATGVPALDAGPDAIVLSLAAAGHAPILTSLRPRVPAVPPRFGDGMVATELARYPDWRLEWPATRAVDEPATLDLAAQLAAPRSPGDPGSDFIFPMMHLTDSSGLAAEVLGPSLGAMTVADARRVLLRVAAHSMLQDDPAVAPYGWTHCLTMPQAVLVAAEHGATPRVAVAVAATFVLGFRAIQGRVRLDDAFVPPPSSAAGWVWTVSDDELPGVIDEIATFGAVHPDAHVAKYTLACLDATAQDPGAGRLFLAAAAHLHEVWQRGEAAA